MSDEKRTHPIPDELDARIESRSVLTPRQRGQLSKIFWADQERLRCAQHPDQGCLTQPESEVEKAQREFRERQERIRGCKFDAQAEVTIGFPAK